MKEFDNRKRAERTKKEVSIRRYLCGFLILLGSIPTIIMLALTLRNLSEQARRAHISKVQMSCYQMEQRLLSAFSYDMFSIDMISSELEHMSALFEGRAMVLDGQLRVLYDSYHLDGQRYFLERHAIEAMEKKKTVQVVEDDSLKIVTPVVDFKGDIQGMLIFVSPFASAKESADLYHEKVTLLFVLVLVAVFVAAYILSGYLSKPIRRMQQAAEGFRDGHQKTIEASRYSELVKTTETINEVIERLNVVDQSRKEFVSNVSHELKTPITSIRLLADSLMQADAESTPVELYREFMNDISEELDREAKIINDLLAMVRLDESAVKMNFTDTDINELFQNLLKRLLPIAQAQDVELVFESFRQVTAPVDETKLTLALSNLIENSIKYNKKDGWVHISLNADHKYFYIKVEDSGIGIPQEDLNKIFDRFYRVDKARSRETGGTGLGLSITKSIILLHQGIIRVFSKENEGTTFQVRIPLSANVNQNANEAGSDTTVKGQEAYNETV